MADLALFDFDGTLTRCETFPPFVRAAVSPLRRRLGVPCLAPVVAGYRLGWVSGVTVRAAVVRVALTGMPVATFEAHARRFVGQALPTLLRPQAAARLDWHRARGDTVAVVSGNFEGLLRPWCETQGIACLASALEARDGRLTGRYLGAQCVGEEKARRVRAAYALDAFDRIHAYGDSVEDFALLALAHERHYRGRPLPAGLPVEALRTAA